MKRVTLILLVCIVAYSAEEPLTLEECLQLVLKNNPDLKIAADRLHDADQSLRIAQSRRLPAVQINGSYRRQSEVPELTFSDLNLFPFAGGSLRLGTLETADFQLTVTQPFFTGLRLKHQQDLAHLAMETRRIDLLTARSDLSLRTAAAYLRVLSAQRVVAICRATLEAIEAHVQDVKNMLQQGMARRDELLQSEVKEAEAEVALVRAHGALAVDRAALENVLGISLPAETEFIEPSVMSFPPPDPDSSLALALEHRVELLAPDLQRRSAELSQKLARGLQYPSVTGYATVGYGKPGLDFIQDEWMKYWVAGVRLQWDIWNWGGTSARVQQARLAEDVALHSKLSTINAIRLQVVEACNRVRETWGRLQAVQKMVRAAEASASVTSNEYRQGLLTSRSVIDAQVDLARARLELAEVETDLVFARMVWRRAVGIEQP